MAQIEQIKAKIEKLQTKEAKLIAEEQFNTWWADYSKKKRVSHKCVNNKTGKIISWVPRAYNIGKNSYHFEDCTLEEVVEFYKEFIMTGKCKHKCGHDEACAYMEEAVCDICGERDMF